MTPEQLKLALTDWFDRLDFDRSNEATRHAEYAELLDIIRAIPPDARVKEALFPDDEIKDGISMSSDAAYNLEGALYDLRRAKSKNSAPDDVCINTIARVIGQLEAARAALSHQPGTADLCPGGVNPDWDECQKCGATSDDECRFAAPSPVLDTATVEAAQKSAPAALGSLPSGESDPSVTLDCAGADTDNINPEVRERQDAEATRQRWRDHAASAALNATHIKLIDIIYGNSSPNMTTEACSDQAHRIAEALISAGLVTPAQGSPMVAHGGGHNDTICIAERKGTALPRPQSNTEAR